MDKMVRFRKKYTPKEAKQAIEILSVQIQNNIEEIHYWLTRDDPLILAMVRMTKQQCIEQALNQNKYLISKIEYIQQYV